MTTTIWPNYLYMAADVVLFAERGGQTHVLLIQRPSDADAFEDWFGLPGGYVERTETPLAAAVRELAEETGIHVRPDHLVEIGRYDNPDRDPRDRVVGIAFAAELPVTVPPTPGSDAADARWFPLDEALEMPLAFDHSAMLDAAVRIILSRRAESVQREG